ncbi:helix-turn-helix transcriptional regulator [Gordonia neofelifaecis]|uniref:Transcriptional regulator n=1 Tax=Gordonia neofelifaecis NRRL B-59395 TaxID=644548 RepID=F1YN04_9ACTN|nr:helix-turn-helix domain-containing protein [Gordonia neofelifaecis]EGD53891.1 transcriptional regulator [Gordonia neofelifaecis NRRL B-59395]
MRDAVLTALHEADAPVTVADLAMTTGIAPTTVRFHLRALVDDGLVVTETARHDGPGRPRLLYQSRPAMDPSGPRNYELLAGVAIQALTELPRAVEHATAAGRSWGARRAHGSADPVDDLMSVLDDFGFAPEPVDDGIRLNRCPFLELAKDHPGVTCSIHRGIMQGVLDAHGLDASRVRLDAFVDGDHCLASITAAAR